MDVDPDPILKMPRPLLGLVQRLSTSRSVGSALKGIYFAKFYGGGGKEMAAGEKNEKEGKRGKGKRRKTA